MTDIDVEAVEDVREAGTVSAPEYVLYGGKGGVGKTTCAAATALASARAGTPTLVVSTDPAHSLSDTLGTEVPAEPARIRDDVPLYGAEIDPDAATGEGPFGADGALGGLEDLLGGEFAAEGPVGVSETGTEGPFGASETDSDDRFGVSETSGDGQSLLGSMPGADEAAAMRLLLEYLDDDRFERVVIDTAPTGHTLRLLELPELMDSTVGTILTLRERLSGLFDGLTGMFGEETADAEAEPDLDDLRVLRERIERLRDALGDPNKTDFRVVMVPEELSVAESHRLLDRLVGFGIPVETIVVNRVLQDPGEVLAGIDAVGPDHEDCDFCARRWDVQQRALARAQDVFQGHDVRRVPLLAEEVRGEELLGVVAACLGDEG